MENKAKKVLIADDEKDILEIISYNLTHEGYDIYTAKDGNEALDMARKIHPDLIILDIMMPYRTGIEVCEILRSTDEFRDTLIIFLTALNDETSHIKALESGGDDYVSKP
ncbi:MAG: response regulator, partial [Panacibacter sp.]